MRIQYKGRPVFLCEVCGFGYSDEATASRCENFCKTHDACSLEITRRAVLRPEA